jgi:hypothetical protein
MSATQSFRILNPAGYTQGLMLLSRHAGLDFATLRESTKEIAFLNLGACKFKKSRATEVSELALTQAIASRAAQLAGAVSKRARASVDLTAAGIRANILQGKPWVGLGSLVDYCWSLGIPVIHVSAFPPGSKKADGIAAVVHDRPVVVLCRQDNSAARQLFILAHEIGHIALKHVANDSVLIDEKLDDNDRDREEDEANKFAIELLTGDSDVSFTSEGRWLTALELAEDSKTRGRELAIDPGHIILNYAHSMERKHPGRSNWPTATAALNIVECEASALAFIRRRMNEELDWASLPEDSSEFLRRVSRIA